jgi:adenylate cyclase
MVVFVGFAEREQSEQQDEFISVYSESSGLSLSGVEIGATAFANLLTTTAVRPLDRNVELLLLASLGFVLALLAGRAPLWLVYAASAVAAVAYLALAVNVFDARNLWLPLIVPLGVQLPVLVLGTTLLRYRRVAEQRSLLRSALGPYAAPSVVTRLARETTRTSGAGQVVHGTCLVTDVSGYTGLAERLGPAELAALMDEYFRAIGRVVADCGGTVADIAGDSMVGVWVAAERQPGTSRSAAEAAIGIERALTAFNAERAQTPLATPIGLEAGVVALTRQADVPALPFRAVGDIVNTAARIQALNRHLGTRLLIGDSVHDALGGWPARRVGRFLLFGKRIPLTIWELEAAATERPDGASLIGDEFAAALALFERGRLQAARSAFADLAAGVPADPVSAFYADQCESLLERGLPDAWDGTIVMRDK